LNDHCVTIAEALKQGGYATAMVGKWHLSHLNVGEDNPKSKDLLNFAADGPISPSTASWPFHRGFDDHIGTIAGVGSFFDPWSLVHNERPIAPRRDDSDFYYTDFINEQAAKRIDGFADAGKPFFLYVAETAPHWPLQANDAAAAARYSKVYAAGWDAIRAQRFERLKRLGLIDEATALSPRANYPRLSDGASVLCAWEDAPAKAWQARRMAVYAAMIERMDRGVGQILDTLRRRGLERNTLVMFLSDNGGCAENVKPNWYDVPSCTRDGRAIRVGNDPDVMPGDQTTFQSYGPAWANTSNTPFRRFKHWTEEGGISAPCIVRWPGKTGEAGRIEQAALGHVIDVMPTFLAAAGVTYRAEFNGKAILPAEGRNLVPAIAGEPFDRDDALFWEHEGNRAVRRGKWKLVGPSGTPWQLYDIDTDRTEANDLAQKDPTRVAEMIRAYEEWARRCGVREWPLTRSAK
jgi:arylsulfatase